MGMRKIRGKKRERRGEWKRKREGVEEAKKSDRYPGDGSLPFSDLTYSLVPTGMHSEEKYANLRPCWPTRSHTPRPLATPKC